jgi:probable rRNA maturation factor
MRLPAKFAKIQKTILGANYDLSVAFVSPSESHRLNKLYRGKDKPTNVLSFPLEKNTGEIVICKSLAKTEAPKFDQSPSEWLHYLFIHGLLHLKGFDHGSTMERKEREYCAVFNITLPLQLRGTNNNNRHRHRNKHR